MPALCRDCLTQFDTGARCPQCRSPRIIAHRELFDLTIAHMDCDAFYASVEKRDNPALRDKPVIIGGGRRGVVSTACYIARIKGVRSAMPMFKALKLCPDAVVIPGNMQRYVEVSQQIRAMMEDLTPAVEPLSLDEAFMDLSGTAKLHKAPPAVLLARLIQRMRDEIGITGSIGLSHNKFLAKIASDQDKPNGYAIIGRQDTESFLANQPVRLIWGIGPSAQAQLQSAGIQTISDLLRWDRRQLITRFGTMGDRLWHLARGQDTRPVRPDRKVKSISNETTFSEDLTNPDLLKAHLWRMAEKCADRAKAKGLGGSVVTLKVKRADFRQVTRRHSLSQPTQLADVIYNEAAQLLDGLHDIGALRLIGVGISALVPAAQADVENDLLDPNAAKRAKAERATDAIRAKFGSSAIVKGRGFRG